MSFKDFFSKPNVKNFGVFSIIAAVLIGVFVGGYSIYLNQNAKYNQIDPKTISITLDDPDNTLYRIYGEPLDLSLVTISYQTKKYDSVITRNPTMDMILNYDSEYIGKQEIQIQFEDYIKNCFVYTSPMELGVPYLGISNDVLSWTKVDNANSYKIYSGTSETSLSWLTTVNTTTYSLSSYTTYGYSYFQVQAVKPSEKYNDSNMSNVVKIYNVNKVTEVTYNNETIEWNAVEGANSYTLDINGIKYQGVKTNNYKFKLNGKKNYITIYAYSDIENSISSVSQSFVIELLEEVNAVSYSNGYITWSQVTGAGSYDIYINDDFYVNTHDAKLYIGEMECGIYKIGIVAKSTTNNIVSSNISLFNCLFNYDIRVSNNLLTWNQLPGNYVYHLCLDGVKQANPLSGNSLDLRNLALSVGEHKLRIIVEGNEKLALNESSEITINKLQAPAFEVRDGVVTATNKDEKIEVYLNGVKINGDLNIAIVNSGTYDVTAKNLAQKENDIDSDISMPLQVEKYAKPIISVNNEKLYCDDTSKTVQYYLDGQEFDGDLSILSKDGEYEVTARYISNDNNKLNSNLSQPLNIKKLAAPTIQLIDEEIVCEKNDINLKYYLDGQEFDGDYNSIGVGLHRVTAQNIGNGAEILNSALSNEILVDKSEVSIEITLLSGNRFNILIETISETINYDLTVYFYIDDSEIDTLTYTDRTSLTQTVSYSRSGQIANRVKIELTLKLATGKSKIFFKEFSI